MGWQRRAGLRIRTLLCLAAFSQASGFAQTSPTAPKADAPKPPAVGQVIFEDKSLGLKFGYPAPLIKDESGENVSAEAKRCLHVLLSVRTKPGCTKTATTTCTEQQLLVPFASLSLMEFDRSCIAPEKWDDHDRLLATLTKALFNNLGAEPIGKPLVYNYGGALSTQSVHMAAVKMPQKDELGVTHFIVQMEMATMVHDRALMWVIQANNHPQLLGLEKTMVSFDANAPVPLFPLDIQDNGASPVAPPQ
jgi:hypothetical protein